LTRLPSTPYKELLCDRGPRRAHVERVIIHATEGSFDGAVSWFDNPQNPEHTGAHLVVGKSKLKGQLLQCADLDHYTNGAIGANQDGVHIEHEAKSSQSRLLWILHRWQRKVSANRAAWVCYHYNLGQPTWGVNLFGHRDLPGNDHTDPGVNFPRDLYQAAARRAYANLVRSGGRKWTR